MKYTMIPTPAAIAVEWEDDGSTYQLVGLRGTSTLLFSMRPEGGSWLTPAPVVRPERFLPGKVRTTKDMKAVADAWFAAGEKAKETHDA